MLATALLLACGTAGAQDFVGGFAPTAPKAPAGANNAKKPANKAKPEKKVALPDLPNALDPQGRKHGDWAPKYPNGRYRYRATFSHGRPVGTVKRYDLDGKLLLTQEFKGGDSCLVAFYHDNGKLQAKGLYVKQLREGTWRLFNYDGYPLALYKYAHGKQHGISELLYEDGKTLEQTTYVNGIKEGPYYKFFASGKKEVQSAYHLDQLDGPYKVWGSDGKLINEGQYNFGTKVGKWHIRIPDADNLEYDILYDVHGLVQNRAEVDSAEAKRSRFYDSQAGKFDDPANYIDHPEDYVPFK